MIGDLYQTALSTPVKVQLFTCSKEYITNPNVNPAWEVKTEFNGEITGIEVPDDEHRSFSVYDESPADHYNKCILTFPNFNRKKMSEFEFGTLEVLLNKYADCRQRNQDVEDALRWLSDTVSEWDDAEEEDEEDDEDEDEDICDDCGLPVSECECDLAEDVCHDCKLPVSECECDLDDDEGDEDEDDDVVYGDCGYPDGTEDEVEDEEDEV